MAFNSGIAYLVWASFDFDGRTEQIYTIAKLWGKIYIHILLGDVLWVLVVFAQAT